MVRIKWVIRTINGGNGISEHAGVELAIVNQVGADPIPAFVGGLPADLREQMTKAVKVWKLRTPFPHTSSVPRNRYAATTGTASAPSP